jgi:hypothetical protein
MRCTILHIRQQVCNISFSFLPHDLFSTGDDSGDDSEDEEERREDHEEEEGEEEGDAESPVWSNINHVDDFFLIS